jgi:hypothetical protein
MQQRARALAQFLAPALRNEPDANEQPDAPAGCLGDETTAGPAVDVAIALELRSAWNKTKPPGNGAAEYDPDQLCQRLAEAFEADEHAVGVLSALVGEHGDQPPDPASQPASGTGRRFPRRPASSLRRAWASICMNTIVGLVLFLAWWLAWRPLHTRPQAGVLSLEVFAVWSLSFLPGWLYVRFLGQRAGALWDEYVLNLYRLRWDRPRHLPRPPVNSEFYAEWLGDGAALLAQQPNIYRQKFDAYYGKSVSNAGHRDRTPVRIEALFPVFLTTAALAVCWTAVLWSPRFTSDPVTFWDVLKFGFLGAYSFILQMLVRRFFQSDLRPAAYANALVRLIVVLILVGALYQLLPPGNPRTAAVIAFLIGFFPLAGMQAIQRFAATTLRVVVPSLSPPYPLNQIDGLSMWYEARLLEEGIEDMQSLATANFVDVMLHTRVPVGRLVDWVDQAHLYLHLDRLEGTWRERQQAKPGRRTRDSTVPPITAGSISVSSRAGSRTRTALRQFGIRNATDLLKAFPPQYVDPGHLLEPGSPWQQHLADVTTEGLDPAQLRTIVRVLAGEPSLAPVWNWQLRGIRRSGAPARDFALSA